MTVGGEGALGEVTVPVAARLTVQMTGEGPGILKEAQNSSCFSLLLPASLEMRQGPWGDGTLERPAPTCRHHPSLSPRQQGQGLWG